MSKRKASQSVSNTSADAVDEQLARYRSMRDFAVTQEPAGNRSRSKASSTSPLPFVLQKHAASHLHYDFRLGWAGVLKSWAVAKGPSDNPKDRRLAVQVEDHPLEYGGFEGIIPAGQYGGGTVMLWDHGSWTPQPGNEDVDAALLSGSLKFELHGTRLHGKWTLVRMKPRPAEKPTAKPNWLLIKEHDRFERAPGDPLITDQFPNSVLTGRSLDQIASQEDHIWNSQQTNSGKQAWTRPRTSTAPPVKNPTRATARASSKSAPKATAALQRQIKVFAPEEQPAFTAPQLASPTAQAPNGDSWLHEIKLDGYRIQARKSGNSVKLLTRTGLDWTHRMPALAASIAALPFEHLTLDGEVCILDEHGISSFARLQAWFQQTEHNPLIYFAFDLLHLNGRAVHRQPLLQRKALLSELLSYASDTTLQLSEHLSGSGPTIFHKACELHAEGIVSKRADAPYHSGRSSEWLKSKCLLEQEFVITGYTDSRTAPHQIGALVLALYDSHGQLHYAGRTGTGFSQSQRSNLYRQLSPLKTARPDFSNRIAAQAEHSVHWVRPDLVAQVRFATWTSDNLVRQAAFLGLREDKPAREVCRESSAVPTPKRPRTLSQERAMPPSTFPALHLTHPGKVLDAASGLTKQELAEYFWAISRWMLPHIANRPLSLVRCPEGTAGTCFFQKHYTHSLPSEIRSISVQDKRSNGPEPYITLDSAEALTSLAQIGVLELHPWGAGNQDLEHPDRLIFDLDPDASVPWQQLAAAAAEIRLRLRNAGLQSFLKTTGGKGLHIVAPIQPEHGWAELKRAAHQFALSLESSNPALFLTKMSKAARRDKIFLDYLRNERGATAVAPYSPRARSGMHAALPLPWSALRLHEPPSFPVKDFSRWKAALHPDPWKKFFTTVQSLHPEQLSAR